MNSSRSNSTLIGYYYVGKIPKLTYTKLFTFVNVVEVLVLFHKDKGGLGVVREP